VAVEFRCNHPSLLAKRRDGQVSRDEYTRARRLRFKVPKSAKWERMLEADGVTPKPTWQTIVDCPECGAEVRVVTDQKRR